MKKGLLLYLFILCALFSSAQRRGYENLSPQQVDSLNKKRVEIDNLLENAEGLMYDTLIAQHRELNEILRRALRHQRKLVDDSLYRISHKAGAIQTRVGLLYSPNIAYALGSHIGLSFQKHRRLEIGLSAGIEYLKSEKDFELNQVVVFAMHKIFLNRLFYATFEPGISIPLSGRYKSNAIDVEYKEEELKSSFAYQLGFGYHAYSGFLFEIVFREQNYGVVVPINESTSMLGLLIGYKL